MSLGTYLRDIRVNKRQLTLRVVEQLAKESKTGADLSSGYLSMLERDEVKEPSPRVLFTLAKIYELDYIDLMKRAKYMPESMEAKGYTPTPVTFRGALKLDKNQRDRVQRIIDFELRDSQRAKRKKEG